MWPLPGNSRQHDRQYSPALNALIDEHHTKQIIAGLAELATHRGSKGAGERGDGVGKLASGGATATDCAGRYSPMLALAVTLCCHSIHRNPATGGLRGCAASSRPRAGRGQADGVPKCLLTNNFRNAGDTPMKCRCAYDSERVVPCRKL
jgi:hypothetical protein